MEKNKENRSKSAQKVGQIMEINVNSTSLTQVLTRVEDLISHNDKFYIVTPNPELILASISDESLKKALNKATISVPDGVGLKIANPKLKILKGRELFLDLIKLAAEKHWKAFLLGGTGNEADLSVKKLQKGYPKLQIKSFKGPMLYSDAKPRTENDEKLEKEAIDQINEFNPQLLFVAFGNPKQEIWVNKHLSKLNIGGAMSVGGTFRYIAGASILPPKWMANLGFEWLWRLFTEPKRIKRIFNAVFVFPIKYFLYKLKN